MDLRGFVLLALLGASGTLAAPTDSSRCAGECAQVYNPKFDYSPGKTYTYQYEASTTVKLPGVAADEPGIGLSATVDISVLTPCEFALKLNNVQLTGSKSGAADFKKIVEEKPLLFSFTDGRVNHVCPDAKEPTWSVNIKRGVLSTIQNSMDKDLESRVREVDIAGQCDTHYEVTSITGKVTTINKRKDLASCTKRVGRITSLQGNTYASFSRVQSPPLAKATQNCGQVIANNLIQSVDCEEVHILRLFARGQHGATTIAKTKLNFVKQSKGSVKNLPRKWEESSLLFDHSEEAPRVTNNVDETLAVLKDICDKSGDALKPEAANDFTRLTYLVRRLSADGIRGILQSLETGLCKTPKTKDIFLSAVKQAGTEGAVQVLVELLNSNRITGRRARIWLTSLAFIQRPTTGTIEAVIPLVDSPNPNRLAILSVSSLVHTFCRRNENCQKEKAVQKLIETLGRHLRLKCRSTNLQEEDNVIAALKAFGNIGLAEKFLPVIQDCVKDNSLPIPVRLSAIDAFRRNPYNDDTRRILVQILEDHSQQTEVRIGSYLSLMRHPSSKTIQKIKWILDNEIVNQVNTFIWTHLKNLQKSKSPVNYELRKLVKDIPLERKYHIDGLKFSRNYEASFYSDKINAGAELDTNIIFTPESFAPRSASLNLTLDLFGYTIDLLEVDVRAANFEYLLEKYYGPTGVVTVHSRDALKSKLRDRWHRISEGIENEATDHDSSHRHRREASYQTLKYKQLQSKAVIKRENKPEGSLSVKVFGNEIRWYDFHSLEDIYDRQDPYNLQDILNRLATHKEVDIARNIMFLDSTSSVPTASGLPLRFDVNGTASVGLKLKSHFDIRQLLLRPRSADIQSYIEPSASIELAGSLIIDAGVTKTGLRLATTLHSSIAIDGTVLLKEREELTVKLDLPKPSIEIINIKSNLYVVDRDTEKAIVPVSTTRYELSGCSRRLGALIGVELCTELSLPRPFINRERPLIPLGGSIAYSLAIRKVDPNLQGYHFTYLNKREADDKGNLLSSKLKLSFNTPGSAKDREYTLDYELSPVNKVLRLNLKTPRTKLGINGDITIGETSREANFVVKVNDDKEYAFHGKSTVERQGDKTILTPVWEITRPGSPKIVLTGTITAQRNRLEIDIKEAPNSEKKSYLLKGHLSTKGDGPGRQSKSETEIELVTPYIESKFAASVEISDDNGPESELKLSFEHGPPGGEKKSASIKIARETKISANEYHIHRALEWKWSRYPEYNLRAKLHLEKEDNNEYENVVDIRWADFEDDRNSFLVEHKYELKQLSRSTVEGSGSLKVSYPRRGVNWDARTKLNYSPNGVLNYYLTLQYAKDKTIKVELDFKNYPTRLPKYTFDLKVYVPGREMRITDSLEAKRPGEYVGVTLLQWQRGESVTLTGVYKNKSKQDLVHHEVEITVQLLNQLHPLRKYTGLIHGENKRYQVKVQVVKPDKIHEVNIQADYSDHNQITSKVLLQLPWINGQLNSKTSRHEFNVNFDFKTEHQRLVGSTDINASPSSAVLNVDFKWDADRDEDKRLTLKANILRTRERAADIKAILTMPNQVIKVDVNYELPATLFNGKHDLKLHVEYEPDRQFDLDATILIDNNQVNRRMSTGKVYLKTRATGPLKIDYNTDHEVFGSQHRLDADFVIKREGEAPLVLKVNHLHGTEHLNSKVSLGSELEEALALGLKGDWNCGNPDGFVVGGGLSIKAPVEGVLRDFEIVIREGWKFNEGQIDIVHENRLRLGPGRQLGIAVELIKSTVANGDVEINGRIQVDTPFENFSTYKVHTALFMQPGDPMTARANFEVVVGSGRSLKAEVRFDNALKGKKGNVYLLFDSSRIPGVFDLTLSFDVSGPSPAVSLTAKIGSINKVIRLELTADANIHEPVTTYDLILSLPLEDWLLFRTKLRIAGQQDAVGIDALIIWDNNKSLTAVGQLESGKNGKLTINSEALKLSDVIVSITTEEIGPKQSLTIKFKLADEKDIEWHVSIEKRPDEAKTFLAESIINLNGEEFLKVKLNKDSKRINNPVHPFSKAYELEIHNPWAMLSTRLGLISEKGPNPSLRICSLDNNQCLILDVYRSTNEQPNLGKITRDFHAKFTVQKEPKDSRTVGVSYSSSQLRASRERTIKLLWHEENNKFLGYVKQEEITGDADAPGFNRKYQIILPSRTIEVRTDKTSSDNGYVYNLHALLDAVREPNRELTINVDVKKSIVGEFKTRLSTILIKHPELKNDLKITNELRLSRERLFLAQRTDYEMTGRKLTIDLKLADVNKLANGFNITYFIGIRQASANNLDFQIKGHRGRTEEGRSVGFELFWLNKEGTPKTYTLLSQVDRVNHVINGIIRTPIRVFDWKGKYEKLEPQGLHGLRADIDFNYNNKLVKRAHIEYSSRPSFNIKYYANPADINRMFRLHGGLVDDRNFEISAVHTRDGLTYNDALFHLQLNTSKLLFSRLRWRPGVLQEVRDGLDARSEVFSQGFEDAVQNFADLAKAEVADKTEHLRSVVKNDIAPVFSAARQKLSNIRQELKRDLAPSNLERLSEVLQGLFGEFIDVPEVMRIIEGTRNGIREAISERLTRIAEILDGLGGSFDAAIDKLIKNIASLPGRVRAWRLSIRAKLPEVVDRVRKILGDIRHVVSDILEDKYVSQAIDAFRQTWDATVGRVQRWIQGISGGVIGSPDSSLSLYDRIKGKLYQYSTRDGELPKIVKGILDAIRAFKEAIAEAIANARDTYYQYREELLRPWSDLYQTNPDFQALVEEIRTYRKELREKYLTQDKDDTQGLKATIRDTTDNLVDRVRTRLAYLIGKGAVYDPQNGLFDYYIPLSRPIESLRDLRHGLAWRGKDRDEGINLQHILDDIKPHFNRGGIRELLPPFEGDALLIGNQHYKTFDNRFYDFAGHCSYILAQDFVDNNFTVILNYGQNSRGQTVKESLLVVSDFHYVVINANRKVSLDGQDVELPVQIENTVVKRLGSVIHVDNNKGFAAVYDLENDFISIHVNGFYFGKLGGLFGNYDNEPSNDFRHPDGQNLTSLNQFVNSWEVAQTCALQDNAASEDLAERGSIGYSQCQKAFESTWSSLEDCFHHVNPKHYLQVCLEETSDQLSNAGGVRKNFCKVVGAYIHTCEAHHNIRLDPPEQCLVCHSASGVEHSSKHQLTEDELLPHSADVLFIIEQKECNRPILVESLDEVAKELDAELNAEGLRNIRYGVVGFGGDGSHDAPHSHTARGQLFADARSIVLVLKSFAFAGTKQSDAFGAINLAANYPFRPGVSKIGLLFLCERCSDSGQSIEYWELQQYLLEIGFRLHVLTTEEFQMRSKPQLTSLIIGIDAQTAYKAKDIGQKVLVGEPDLRRHVTGLKDLCYTMAQELNGSVFRSDLFDPHKSNVAKNAKGVFVRRIAANSSPPSCQLCSCEVPADVGAGRSGMARSVCRLCLTPKPHTIYQRPYDDEQVNKIENISMTSNLLNKRAYRRRPLLKEESA